MILNIALSITCVERHHIEHFFNIILYISYHYTDTTIIYLINLRRRPYSIDLFSLCYWNISHITTSREYSSHDYT